MFNFRKNEIEETKKFVTEDSIKDLIQNEIRRPVERLQEVEYENERLYRILKHVNRLPCFEIEEKYGSLFKFCTDVILYLYIENEEYIIQIKKYYNVDKNKCELKMDGSVAYFKIAYKYGEKIKFDTLIIDYKNGNYIVKN